MIAYVLAGGRSSRMGQSKTELFLPRILAAARPVFEELVAVQRCGGESVDGLRTLYEDPHEDEGAIFGVARALRDAAPSAQHPAPRFILAVDYPLITSEVLRFLASDGRVPVWNGHPQPLCAVWSASLLPRVEERIAARRFDLQALRERDIIPEPVLRARFAGEPLLNVNTPEELMRAEKLNGQ